MKSRFLVPALGALALLGCSSSDAAPAPAPASAVPEFGADDARAIVVVGTPGDGLDGPRALAFDPELPDRLWITNGDLGGVVIYQHLGTDEQSVERRSDVFAPHFMPNPSALAFGQSGSFATCPESRDSWNGAPQPEDDFMGPTLWSSDLEVFAKVNQDHGTGKEGSHLDMLHESPLCMGLEHDDGNAYFAFDGLAGQIVRFDFKKDHGPGGTNHTDGVVKRFLDAKVTRLAGVPSHLALDHDTGILYVADTGAGRVMALDTTTGAASPIEQDKEPLANYSKVEGAAFTLVKDGLKEPSGLALHDGKLFVAEHATGDVVAFDLAGKELGRVHTGAKSLMGIAFSADGKLHAVDHDTSRLLRIDPVKDPAVADRPVGAPLAAPPACEAIVNDAPDVIEERIPQTRPDATVGGTLPDGRYHLTKIQTYTGLGGPMGQGDFRRRETYVVKMGTIVGVQRDLGDPKEKDYGLELEYRSDANTLHVHSTCNDGPAALRSPSYDVTETGAVLYFDYTGVVMTWTRVP